MKIVQINSVSYGSTGSIMLNIHSNLLHNGIESYAVWGRGKKSNNKNEIYMNDKLGVYFHKVYTLLTSKTGLVSINSTKKLLNRLDEIKPDIIHLHNIHGYYINIELLFNYIKKNNIKTIWTLHDCWAFTGHCSYFTYTNCNKWKKECNNCPKYKEYPKSIVDNSLYCYKTKKELFTSIEDLTIITPSKWLANLAKKSFLGKYKIEIINNGIDTNIFKKIDRNKLKFRKKYNLEDKKIILGVASPFSNRKGFNDFISLSKIIDDNYVIVLVGLTKKQISNLPINIIGIKRTSDINELVDIYNSSNIFVNLTYEDNYPTVNLEAIACGTPVLTYDTGGSTEFTDFLKKDKNIYVINKKSTINNLNILKKRIEDIVSKNTFEFKNTDLIDKKEMIKKYIKLYKNK